MRLLRAPSVLLFKCHDRLGWLNCDALQHGKPSQDASFSISIPGSQQGSLHSTTLASLKTIGACFAIDLQTDLSIKNSFLLIGPLDLCPSLPQLHVRGFTEFSAVTIPLPRRNYCLGLFFNFMSDWDCVAPISQILTFIWKSREGFFTPSKQCLLTAVVWQKP